MLGRSLSTSQNMDREDTNNSSNKFNKENHLYG